MTTSATLAPTSPAAGPARALAAIDVDAAFAFAIFLDLLFILQSGTLGAAVFVGLVTAYGALRRDRLLEILRTRGLMLLVPAFALASVLWSEAPKATLQYGVEYLVTVFAGLLISAAPRPAALLKGVWLAFLIYCLVSLALGQVVAVGVNGEQAFAGLNGGKNLMGDIAATGALASVAVVILALSRRQPMWALAAAAAALVELYVLARTHSAGSVMGLAIGGAVFVGLALIRAAPRGPRVGLVAALAVAAALLAPAYRWLEPALVDTGITLFAKDETLTGRTYLWYRAYDLIAEKPMLGRGFAAFWLQGNIDAEGLWRYAGIASRGGFTFHNTLVELLVQVGWLGAAVFVAGAVAGGLALIFRFMARPSLVLGFWIAVFVYEMARTPIESIGVFPFFFSTVLVFAAVGMAFNRAADEGPARPPS